MTPPGAFDLLFAAQLDPAALIDPERDRFVKANASAEALLGYDRSELAAMSPADIHPHELARLNAFMSNIRRAGSWTADDLSCRTRTGDTVPALIRAQVIEIDGRELVLVLIRDRREHRLAELGAAVRQLTHDLKNTLSSAQLMCDRLATDDDRRVRLSAESITRALERAVALCRDAAGAGRARTPAPERERFLLADVMEELEATAVGATSLPRRLTDDSAGPVHLDVDFDQTYRILLNLVHNAFAAGAGHVAVTGQSDARGATLEVADDGPGLPEEGLCPNAWCKRPRAAPPA
ncbi:PAS domain-containing protein [Roseovarius salinarum]|uniref:PAS domain-containing protein n=1 Tax=Roseovarius salinarum TaxID=1981892 RepID=UPI000C342FAA|nr:PAS domain-containing sensor histidine kinase [Roseovarius salinarum]